MANQKTPNQIHSMSQLRVGARIEHILTGQKFTITANNGNRATAVDNVVLVVVNDNAYKDWYCTTSDQPLRKLKPGDMISNKHAYVVTYVADYIVSASRSVEVTNHSEYYLLD